MKKSDLTACAGKRVELEAIKLLEQARLRVKLEPAEKSEGRRVN